eukprot:CAMPEP_0170518264 /NCGR_PEP_ID=MMETSP0209-20121228/3990_1 /TAXON_ID=665100 ORGANISM="Litonotus pictus, Strain P1" /NCGR_SAMPLE_ID=MMETSP0209 /ASSEMBLY_ACC=CAM_ASM_000301 /LENGTH=235 /DNA_ID=CAMNT_0010803747 /DNA_START=68 /DNA_END=776 /DNA_ORIENTATION=-
MPLPSKYSTISIPSTNSIPKSFSLYTNSKFFFAKKASSSSKKETQKQKDKEVKSKLNEEYENISQEDIQKKYDTRTSEIIKAKTDELSKISNLRVSPKLFEGILVHLKTQKNSLSEISSITIKGANIINIAPFDASHKDPILKSLQLTKLDLQINSEGNNIVIVVGTIPKEVKLEYSNKVKKVESGLKEELKKLKNEMTAEIKKLEKITGKDQSKKLEKKILEVIDKQAKSQTKA